MHVFNVKAGDTCTGYLANKYQHTEDRNVVTFRNVGIFLHIESVVCSNSCP